MRRKWYNRFPFRDSDFFCPSATPKIPGNEGDVKEKRKIVAWGSLRATYRAIFCGVCILSVHKRKPPTRNGPAFRFSATIFRLDGTEASGHLFRPKDKKFTIFFQTLDRTSWKEYNIKANKCLPIKVREGGKDERNTDVLSELRTESYRVHRGKSFP